MTTSRHLTSRFWLSVIAVTLLGTASLVFHDLGPLAVATPFLLALALGVADGWWPAMPEITARITAPRTIEGDDVAAELTIRASERVPWLELELQVGPGLSALDPLRIVTSAAAGETAIHTISLRAERFGVSGLEWVTVVGRDLFGFSERVMAIPLDPVLRVHPPTERLRELVPLRRVRATSGEHRSRHRGSGTELAEVRPYRSGDPARMVHPRISSRRGQPMVLERHPDRASDTVLYVDSLQDIGIDLDTTLRWTVMAAVALAERHGRAMDRVALLDRGSRVRWLPPTLGRRALHELTDLVLQSAVVGRNDAVLRTPPHHLVPTGATIFAISPMLSGVVEADLQQFRRFGHQVIVIEPQVPVPTSISDLARRIHRLERVRRRDELARRGIATVLWETTESLGATLRRAGATISKAAT